MNRGPSLFELFVDLATNVVIDAWEVAHRARVQVGNLLKP